MDLAKIIATSFAMSATVLSFGCERQPSQTQQIPQSQSLPPAPQTAQERIYQYGFLGSRLGEI